MDSLVSRGFRNSEVLLYLSGEGGGVRSKGLCGCGELAAAMIELC